MPFVTVYCGQPQINIRRRGAAGARRAARHESEPAPRRPVRNAPAGRTMPPRLLALLGPAQALADDQGSKAFRVTARIAFDSGQRMTTEVVIFMLDSGTEPYRVLTWRDDIDDAPADRNRTTLR